MSYASNPSRVRLRPRSDAIHISRGRTVLGMSHDGVISPDTARNGLYVYQTRTLSKYRWTLEGKQPQLSAQSPVEQHSWLGYYFQAPPNCKETPTGDCDPLQQTLELKISRVVGEGMHEDLELTNHTQIATSVTLALEAECDFVAGEEIKKGRRQQGELKKRWEQAEGECLWDFDYYARHHYEEQGNVGDASVHRGITLHLRADSEPEHSESAISFRITLKPHQTWKACLQWRTRVNGNLLPIEPKCNALMGSDYEWFRKEQTFLRESSSIHTPAARDASPDVQRALDRSRLDIAALRLYDLDEGEHNWKLAAGIPTYQGLFGRDLLAAAWEASMLSADMSRGALSLLARLQSHETNDWRDAQPGRMLHEVHTDPLAALNFTPSALYFGTANVPFLFPIVVSELWHWTGDKDLLRRYVKPALETLAWADKYSRDPQSSFYKYQTNSRQGAKNQGWKDSSDCIVYPDGSQVEDPLGTCELQAFAYTAKLHFAEFLWWMDENEPAHRLHREALELKQRFNDRFWMEDEGYVAMAIDKDNQLVRTIASDPGHCLLSGILETERVPRLINRMMQPDLFSGWGIRTLSSKHPAYNPFAYHRGTVWPVENGSFVLGMARYGAHGEMWQLARALFEVASLFDYDRLPELFAGHARDEEHPFPGLYERADSPQAWSASAPFIVMQALLGIYPYGPLKVLFLDPWLPEWLPEISIEDMRVGDAQITLHFQRNKDGKTDYKIERLDGKLHILRQPSPWSLIANKGERVKDLVTSLLRAA